MAAPAELARGLLERVWAGRPGASTRLLGAALTPLELAFRGVVAVRGAAYDVGILPAHTPPAPTISVGNLTVGGAGKTPLARWLVRELEARGRTPGILHGGYADDEPALLRQWFPDLPVVAERDRLKGARAAVEEGADILVLDDAFQHRRIRRNLDVALVAAERWDAPARLLPRGPYREPRNALRRADVVVVTRRTAPPAEAAAAARDIRGRTGRPAAVAHLGPGSWLTPEGADREGAPPGQAVAVAGIARPDAFFQQVAGTGVAVGGRLAFRDHHAYSPADADRIRRLAGGGPVVTTAKDAVKLSRLLPAAELWVLDQTVAFEEGQEAVQDLLDRVTR